jgi:hypothetical protein
MLQDIGWFVSVGFGALGIACWFAGIFFGMYARFRRKPGVPWFSPRLAEEAGYTEAGWRAFKRSWACVLGFLVCWVLSVGVGIIAGAFVR